MDETEHGMDETLVPAELLTEDPPFSEEEWSALLNYAEIHGFGGDAALVMEDLVADDLVKPVMPDVPRAGRWRVRTEADAAWAMARLCEAEAEEKAIDAQYAAYQRKISAAWERRQRRPRASVAFMRSQLEQWGHARRLDNPKGPATFQLPTGKVTTREYAAKAQIQDASAVIEWVKRVLPADAVAAIVKTKESITVTDLRKHVRVADVPVACDVTLACGHTAKVDEPTTVGEVVFCDKCGAINVDQADQDEAMQPIAEILSVYRQISVVAAESSELQRVPVPGTRVEHSHVDVTVQPG